MAALNGYNGNISGNGISGTLRTWSASFTRAATDVTGFSNVGRNRILGVYDMTGSAGGVIDDTAAGFAVTTVGGGNFVCFQTATGSTVTLTVASGKSVAANCVCEQVDMNVDKTGEATITFNFSLASTATGTNTPFTVVW